MLVHQFTRLLAVSLVTLAMFSCGSKTPEEYLTSARSHYDQGNFNAALIEAKNALKQSSKYADARIMLGDVHSKLADYNSALGEYERALDLGASGPVLETAIARAKLRLGRVQEVIGQFEEVEARDEAMDLVLAEGYLLAGDLPAAKPLFEAYPNTAMGQMGMAGLAWNAGDLERAGKHYAQALEIEPDHTEVWLKQGELQLVKEDYDAAIASFQKANMLPGGRPVGKIGVVRTLLAQDQVGEASKRVDEVLELAPQHPLALYLRGLVNFRQEDMKSAESSLQAVLSRYPGHAPSQYLMGLVKHKLGQYSQSEDYLVRYLARDETNESVRKLLASVRFDRGDLKGVIDVLNDSESLSQDPQVLAMLGSAKLRSGDLSGATSALERAVELAPDMAPFRNQLALSLLSAGKKKRAEATLQDAIKVDGEQFQSDYLIAMLQLRDGDYKKAGEAASAIVEKSPDNPIGHNLVGAVALAQGQIDEARKSFSAALDISPTFEPAANNLARLLEAEGARLEAKKVYERALEVKPDNEGALVGLAELAVRDGMIVDAIRYLERSVAASPDSLRSRLGLARLQAASGDSSSALDTVSEALAIHQEHPDFLALQAQLDLQSGNLERAEDSISKLQQLLSTNPKNSALAAMLGELQLRIGNRTMARRNYESVLDGNATPSGTALLRLARMDLAENKLNSARKRLGQLRQVSDINSDVSLLLEGDINAAQGDSAAALKIYQELASRNNRDGILRQSTMLFRGGDNEAGTKVLEGWLANNEGDQGARAFLAGALLSAGESQGARKHYEALLGSGNPVVLNNLAWIYMEEGDARAVDLARQAVTAAPSNSDIADTYGWVLIQMGDAVEGIRVIEDSMQSSKKTPTALYHLGVGYEKIGDKSKAKEVLQEALKLGSFAEQDAAAELLRTLG